MSADAPDIDAIIPAVCGIVASSSARLRVLISNCHSRSSADTVPDGRHCEVTVDRNGACQPFMQVFKPRAHVASNLSLLHRQVSCVEVSLVAIELLNVAEA